MEGSAACSGAALCARIMWHSALSRVSGRKSASRRVRGFNLNCILLPFPAVAGVCFYF